MSAGGGTAVAAVIFDLDGVLVDTEPTHLAATRALIAPAEITLQQYERFIGRGGFKQWLEATYDIPRAVIDARYGTLFYEELEGAPLRPLDGAVELLDAVRERKLGLAVASQSSPAWVAATLRSCGLAERFALVVTAEEAGRDKPAPDIYLHTARLLDAAPARCIAVEDSVHGLASASAAGMRVVQLRQASFTPPPQAAAHAVIERWRDFDLRWLDGEPLG